MKHKMITLDDVTFERAKEMLNFSKWVRQQIRFVIEDEEKVGWYYCERCNLPYELKVSKAQKFCCPPCRADYRLPAMIEMGSVWGVVE